MLTQKLAASLTARALAAQPFKSVLYIDGIRHEGCRGSAQSTRSYRPEGYSANFVLAWIGNASEFKTPPKPGTICEVDGQRLEVASIPEIDPAGAIIRIDLKTPSSIGA